MRMNPGERWRCTSEQCRCEVLVESPSRDELRNPVCVCGAVMKKPYAPPVLRYLDFLRLTEAVSAAGAHRRE